MSFKRNCPNCGKELLYPTKIGMNRANRCNSLCKQCRDQSLSNNNNPKVDYTQYYDSEKKSYFYKCHTCSSKIYVASRRGVRQGLQAKSSCRQCVSKDDKVQTKISNAIKRSYQNPSSGYNCAKYIEERRLRLSKLFVELNRSDKNPSFKE